MFFPAGIKRQWYAKNFRIKRPGLPDSCCLFPTDFYTTVRERYPEHGSRKKTLRFMPIL